MTARVSDVWDFKRDDKGLWRWRLESLRHELLQEAPVAFKEFDQCVADAKRCGYTGSVCGAEPPARSAKRSPSVRRSHMGA